MKFEAWEIAVRSVYYGLFDKKEYSLFEKVCIFMYNINDGQKSKFEEEVLNGPYDV